MPGITLKLSNDYFPEEIDGTRVTLNAGSAISRIVTLMKQHQLVGAEFLAGIPGTLGGATAMNAGTKNGECMTVVEAVELATPDGLGWVSGLSYRYRHTDLPPGAVVTRIRFALRAGDLAESAQKMEADLAYRKRTQPLSQPNFGSVFTNPSGHFAGSLIEQVELKGHRVGNAQISTLHANWIVNLGGATAADVTGADGRGPAPRAGRHRRHPDPRGEAHREVSSNERAAGATATSLWPKNCGSAQPRLTMEESPQLGVTRPPCSVPNATAAASMWRRRRASSKPPRRTTARWCSSSSGSRSPSWASRSAPTKAGSGRTPRAQFALSDVKVSGQSEATDVELVRLGGVLLGQNLVAMDVRAMERAIATPPLGEVGQRDPPPSVRTCRSTWWSTAPSRCCRCGELYLVNEDAVPFKRIKPGDAIDLPLVTGLDRDGFAEHREETLTSLRQALTLIEAYAAEPGRRRSSRCQK